MMKSAPMTAKISELDAALSVMEQSGWYADRSEEVKGILAKEAQLRSYGKRENVFLAGDPSAGLYGLAEGSLQLMVDRSDGDQVVMHRAEPGFWIGDLALFANKGHQLSAWAANHVKMVFVPASALWRLTEEDPKLLLEFYELTYANVQSLFKVYGSLSRESALQRVASRLILQSELKASDGDWLHISQNELAEMLNHSLPTLQRSLRHLADSKIIELGYGKIKILDSDALTRINDA